MTSEACGIFFWIISLEKGAFEKSFFLLFKSCSLSRHGNKFLNRFFVINGFFAIAILSRSLYLNRTCLHAIETIFFVWFLEVLFLVHYGALIINIFRSICRQIFPLFDEFVYLEMKNVKRVEGDWIAMKMVGFVLILYLENYNNWVVFYNNRDFAKNWISWHTWWF